MLRFTPSLVIAGALLVFAGCGDDSASSYVEAQWQLRCLSVSDNCGTDRPPPHQAMGTANDQLGVRCSVSPTTGGNRQLELTIRITNPGGDAGIDETGVLRLQHVVFDDSFAVVGGTVQVSEEPIFLEAFEGDLGNECTLTGFAVADTSRGRALSGSLSCTDLHDNQGRSPDLGGVASPGDPATFAVTNCSGL